jgi:hypothetical protein
MWESWRTYISFVLVGAIFILCQALAGHRADNQSEASASDAADRTFRDARIVEASGLNLRPDAAWLTPAATENPAAAAGDPAGRD